MNHSIVILLVQCTKEQHFPYRSRHHNQALVSVQALSPEDTLLSPNQQMHKAAEFLTGSHQSVERFSVSEWYIEIELQIDHMVCYDLERYFW